MSEDYCIFCGAKVGQISERTGKSVSSIYDCPQCGVNYCDQCSYEAQINKRLVQVCLRCDSEMNKVT